MMIILESSFASRNEDNNLVGSYVALKLWTGRPGFGARRFLWVEEIFLPTLPEQFVATERIVRKLVKSLLEML